MAYPYQQMKEQQAAKAEPDLPSDSGAQPNVHVIPLAPSYPAMGQPYQGEPGTPVGQYQGQPVMGQPFQPQPYSPTMAQSFQPQMATMPYPMQPGAVPYAQPYIPQPFMQPVATLAQPIQPAALPPPIQCVICTTMVAGTHFRCVGCKNNGRPGGYLLCPTCHSRQKVKEKGLFDEINQGLGDLTHNSTSTRPHERWHPYERVDPVVAAPSVFVVPAAVPGAPPQFVQAVPFAPVIAHQNIQLILGCKDLQRQGFGFVLPDPSIAVSINGKEVAHTEEAKQACTATFQRTVEVSNAEATVTFTVYTSGTKHGVATTTMSELLKAPNQTWSKPIEDPKKGYRLQSGVVVVRWVPTQVAQPVAVAQPFMGGQAPAPQYAQAPQYYAAPPAYQ